MQITAALLRKFVGARAPAATLDAIAKAAPTVLPKYGITTALRLQHFFAQIAHESGGFTIREENTRYTAKRIAQVWPSRPAAVKFANDPEGLANSVYANRMGNGPPSSGDGYRYRGRGLAQHTGKDGYAAIERITNLPLVDNPDLVNAPRYLLECAAAFWQWKKLAPLADRDDIVGVTKRWNGGLIGVDDRRAWLAKAKKLFTSDLDAVPISSEQPPKPNDATALPGLIDVKMTKQAQERLRELGYVMVGEPDGLWGARSAAAVTAFCRVNLKVPYADPLTRELYDAIMAPDAVRMPIAPERSNAPPDVVKEIAPEAAPVRDASFWAKVQGALSAVGAAIWGVLSNLGDASGLTTPLGLAGAAAIIATLVVAYIIWKRSQAADTAITEAVQTGARVRSAEQ